MSSGRQGGGKRVEGGKQGGGGMFTYCVDLKSIDCSISEIFPGIPEPRRFCLWRLSLCVFVFVPVSFCVCVCVCVCVEYLRQRRRMAAKLVDD